MLVPDLDSVIPNHLLVMALVEMCEQFICRSTYMTAQGFRTERSMNSIVGAASFCACKRVRLKNQRLHSRNFKIANQPRVSTQFRR